MGQVATKWSRTLGVDRIVVADDTAAASDIMQKSLMMAAPATCKTAIVTVDKAVSLCNDPRAAGLKILLIVSTPENLLRVAKEVKDIPQINVGNYGRIAPKARNGSPQDLYQESVCLRGRSRDSAAGHGNRDPLQCADHPR